MPAPRDFQWLGKVHTVTMTLFNLKNENLQSYKLLGCSHLALFPGPTQLFSHEYVEKKLGGAWGRG